MKLHFSILLTVMMALASSQLHAQHSDVEFGYDDASNPSDIMIQSEESITTADGIIVVRNVLRELDPFTPGDFAADQPGFTTNDAAGLIFNDDDAISITALDATEHSSFGVGYVNFYNPDSDALEATGRIAFEDNTTGTSDLILNGDSVESGEQPQFIGIANSSGNVHDHIVWNLLDDDTAPLGAYGLLVQIEGDFDPFDGTIEVSSEPFWLIFNHGMSDSDFVNLALPRFGVGATLAPQVVSVAMNGGEAQRSAVETLSVLFDSEVTIENGAFSLVQRSTATAETFEDVTIIVSDQVINGETQVTIQFDSHVRNSDNALEDGNYQLTIDASLVTSNGTPMDSDFVFGSVAADAFFAYFGDSDGNRSLNIFDLLAFRQTYLASEGDTAYRFFMDFSADGAVNIFDLLPFRTRYLTTLPFTFDGSRSGSLTESSGKQSSRQSVKTRR